MKKYGFEHWSLKIINKPTNYEFHPIFVWKIFWLKFCFKYLKVNKCVSQKLSILMIIAFSTSQIGLRVKFGILCSMLGQWCVYVLHMILVWAFSFVLRVFKWVFSGLFYVYFSFQTSIAISHGKITTQRLCLHSST